MMIMAHDDNDQLAVLAEEFISRCRSGEPPSVEEYATQHPELAEEIRDLFPTILTVERVKHISPSTSDRLDAGWEPPLGRLGDFRIVRELGRGGMGIVYEAEQESLGRRVAIKVLPRQHITDGRRRERFDRESRTAAKLHHTNIVPVFGVGEQDGYHYFVMQYIRGVGLDVVFRTLTDVAKGAAPTSDSSSSGGTVALLRVARDLLKNAGGNMVVTASDASTLTASMPARPSSWGPHTGGTSAPSSKNTNANPPPHEPALPSRPAIERAAQTLSGVAPRVLKSRYWRDLATLLAQAADALAYAHSQDVLHRDIKPSNLLLDAEGTLWVADFGLAKVVDHEGITQAGDVVGTLRYMAPEQFKGHMDVRSDVYSLGVTLYELATLRPAFTESKASSVIQAIMEKPMTPPRQLCPSMPHDLETIIMKATAREPGHRYATAADLRDDLHRFAEDRPILARRISSIERLRRWAWRNPALATTTGLSFALLATVAVVASTGYFNVRSANSRTESALVGETRQHKRAEATADLAVKALDAMFKEFAPESLLSSHEFSLDGTDENTLAVSAPIAVSRETTVFLENMLDFYRRLGAQEADLPEVQLKVAGAQRRVGEIYERLGQFGEAEAAYANAMTQYEHMLRASPDNPMLQASIARVHNLLASVLLKDHQPEQAFVHLEAADKLLRPIYAGGKASPDAQFELARTFYFRSGRRGNVEMIVLSQGMPGFPGMGPGGPGGGGFGRVRQGPGPDDGGPPPERGPGPGDRGPEGRGFGRPDDGHEPFDRGGRRMRGEWNFMALRPPESRPSDDRRPRPNPADLEEAVKILTALSERSPQTPQYRHLLALCLLNKARPMPGGPRGGERTELDRAVGILEQLADDFKQVPEYQFDLADAYVKQSMGVDDRCERLKKAIGIMEKLVSAQPNVPAYRFSLACYLLLPSMRPGRGEPCGDSPEKVFDNQQRAVDMLEKLADQFQDAEPYGLVASRSEMILARAIMARAQFAPARDLLLKAVDRARRVVAPAEGDRRRPRMPIHDLYEELAKAHRALHEDALADQAQKTADQERARNPRPSFGEPPPERGGKD